MQPQAQLAQVLPPASSTDFHDESPMYKIQRDVSKAEEAYFDGFAPPSSPPQNFRRKARRPMQTTAQLEKMATLNAKLPALTTNACCRTPGAPSHVRSGSNWKRACHLRLPPLTAQAMDAIIQGKPKPKKTFTELLPVTLPTELSA
mmetsp:Transcript_87181/g.242730  ORF Transcript_87181/g.242730 Transcript_87181/m.242730 type:complete len:146 (+) Transcript_87181:102-539(+)